MVSHAFGTSTPRIAFLFTFLDVDLGPRVATSLIQGILLLAQRFVTGTLGVEGRECSQFSKGRSRS